MWLRIQTCVCYSCGKCLYVDYVSHQTCYLDMNWIQTIQHSQQNRTALTIYFISFVHLIFCFRTPLQRILPWKLVMLTTLWTLNYILPNVVEWSWWAPSWLKKNDLKSMEIQRRKHSVIWSPKLDIICSSNSNCQQCSSIKISTSTILEISPNSFLGCWTGSQDKTKACKPYQKF